MLQKFGEVLFAYKDVTVRGANLGTSMIRLPCGSPPAIQRLPDSLPSRFDMLNDAIKEQEGLQQNVGQVAATSSLRRFNTAKDDNEKKTLA